LGNQFGHLLVDIDGINFVGRPNRFGQFKSGIATASADVGDCVARTDLQGGDDFIRLLPLISADAFIGELFEFAAAEQQAAG